MPVVNPGGGGAGGGAVTVADGADVAQGSTADALGANTVIGQLKKIAAAGGSAVSIADGSDVAEGATADAAVTSDVAGTVSGKLRGLVKIFADVWDSVNHRLHVVVDAAPSTAVTNAGLTNLDVALSTRTKPTDQQHAIIDSGTTVVTQGTGTNLHTVVDSGAVNATLGAETTKVIGTVNQGTSPWVTSSTLAAETTKVIGTVNQGTSPWVTSATLAAETSKVIGTINIASAQTLATVSTVTAVTTVSASRTVGNTGATLDGAINGAAPTNALWATHAPSTASAASCLVKNGAALTVLNVKASAGSVYGATIVNKAATVIYLQFYNTSGTPTLGTSVINWIPIAASATLVIPPGSVALSNYATGIGIGASTTPTSTGTPGTAPDVSIWYI